MPAPAIVAHRGGSALGPENTLASIRTGLARGVAGVEIDVRATADGVAVLMHDETVDRTTDGSGRVDTTTLRDLRRLNAAARWSGRAVGYERPPTLTEALRAVDGRARVFIEVKPAGIERAVVAAIAEADARDWVEVHSFLDDVLVGVRAIDPGTVVALVTAVRPDDPVEAAIRAGASGVAMWCELVRRDPGIVDRARQAGLRCYVWTVNDAATYEWLGTLGVDAVITDSPDLANSPAAEVRLAGRPRGPIA